MQNRSLKLEDDEIMQAKIKDLFASISEVVVSKLTLLFSSNGGFVSTLKIWSGTMPCSFKELFERLMSPCLRLMEKLDLNTKLMALFTGFFVVIVILTAQTLTKLNDEKNIAKEELQGVQIAHQIMDVLIETQKHRGQVNLKLSGQDVNIALTKTRTNLKLGIDQMDAFIEGAPDFELTGSWKPIAEELRQLVSGQIASTTAQNFAQPTTRSPVSDVSHATPTSYSACFRASGTWRKRR